MMRLHTDLPEEVHASMRAAQGRHFVAAAAEQLYFCWQQCEKDGYPWPETLDLAWELLWLEMGKPEALRLTITGRGEKDAR